MIPLPRELSTCRACGEPVLWTWTEHRNRMAVDPKPDDLGNQACYRSGSRGTWSSRSLDATGARPVAAWEHRFIPHVATCKPRPRQEALPLPIPLPANVVRLDPKKRRRRRQSR